MGKSYLDNDGLKYLWKKIKALIPTKVSDLNNDKSYITSDYSIQARGDNLITNGAGTFGDNTNFHDFEFDGMETCNSLGSFKCDDIQVTRLTDEYIPVDPSKNYKFSCFIKNNNTSAKYYDFLSMYDVDKKEISAKFVGWIEGSTTTIVKDLKDGDTVIYLADISGFNKKSTEEYKKGLIVWNYKNSYGYQYSPESYSRNVYRNLWKDASSFNDTNNSITLSSAWTGGTITSGTVVSQSNDGATYNYMDANYTLDDKDTWYSKEYFISGIGKNHRESGKFRPGTAYVRAGWLMNRGVDSVTTHLASIELSKIQKDNNKRGFVFVGDSNATAASYNNNWSALVKLSEFIAGQDDMECIACAPEGGTSYTGSNLVIDNLPVKNDDVTDVVSWCGGNDCGSDAETVKAGVDSFIATCKIRYPNLKRIYLIYGSTTWLASRDYNRRKAVVKGMLASADAETAINVSVNDITKYAADVDAMYHSDFLHYNETGQKALYNPLKSIIFGKPIIDNREVIDVIGANTDLTMWQAGDWSTAGDNRITYYPDGTVVLRLKTKVACTLQNHFAVGLPKHYGRPVKSTNAQFPVTITNTKKGNVMVGGATNIYRGKDGANWIDIYIPTTFELEAYSSSIYFVIKNTIE